MELHNMTKQELLETFDVANDNYWKLMEGRTIAQLLMMPEYSFAKHHLNEVIAEMRRRRLSNASL